MASTFPPPPLAGARLARPPRLDSSGGIASLAEIIADVSSHGSAGAPADTPRGPSSHFFPSVPRAQREQARLARLAAASPGPITSSTPPPPSPPPRPVGIVAVTPSKIRGIDALLSAAEESQSDAAGGIRMSEDKGRREWARERQAKVEPESSGPFDLRRSPVASMDANPPPGSSGKSKGDSTGADVDDGKRGVGTGGSGGTKRRRDIERTGWDAGTDFALRDRELQKGIGGDLDAAGVEQDREKTPTPNTGRGLSPPSVRRSVSFQEEDTAMSRYEGSASPGTSPKPPSIASTERDDDAALDDDDASIATGRTGANGAEVEDDDVSGKQPAKKRSRTLTTPAQTAVLNALLAKTRFPSTETREEVGKQIGMSARRVQIWFQNRRQSQKRQRDRDAQEVAAASAAQAAAMAAGHHHAVYGAPPQLAYAVDSYGRAAHFYPPVQPKPHQQAMNGGYQHRPDMPRHPSMESLSGRSGYALGQHSIPSLHAREGMAQRPADQRYAHPYAMSGAAAYASYGQAQQHVHEQQQLGAYPASTYPSHLRPPPGSPQPHLLPPKLYFPSVPRSHVPSGRVGADPYRPQLASPVESRHGAGPDGRLPSLSSVLHSGSPSTAGPVSPANGHVSSPAGHQPLFSHSPFSPTPPAYQTVSAASSVAGPSAPILAQAQPTGSRSLFSPEPSSSFERLRISSGPLSPIADAGPDSNVSATPTPTAEREQQDVLDMAMDRMAYRAHGRALPARQSLPPLRIVFGDPVLNTSRAKKGGPSEADKALLKPIGAGASSSASGSSDGPPRLAPLQTFPPIDPSVNTALSPSPVSPHSQAPTSAGALAPHSGVPPTSRASTWSDVSHATRSSAASFEFGAPPPGSYRSEHSSLVLATGSGGSAGERPLPPAPMKAIETVSGEHGRSERGVSVETEETSAAPSVSSEGGTGVKP